MGSTDKEICSLCYKKVLDKGVECEGDCKRWFHPECVKLSSNEYKKIADGVKKTWFCGIAEPNSFHHKDLDGKLNLVLEKLGKLDKIDDLARGISEIKDDISSIRNSLDSLEPRVTANEDNISSIKQDIASIQKQLLEDRAPPEESIIEEMNERRSRARNVILHGLSESKKRDSNEAKQEDEELLTSIIRDIQQRTSSTSLKFFRLGKMSQGRNRPIKLILSSESEAIDLLKAFAKESSKFDYLKGISFTNDKTPKERDYLKSLRSMLAKNISDGEKDITIKFINGIPKIVQKN